MNHENNVATASGKTDNMPKDYIYCPAADGPVPALRNACVPSPIVS